MTESADPQHGDKIARQRAAVAERVVGRDARAHQRRGVLGREPVGDACERLRRRNHVLGIAAIVGDAGDLQIAAGDEIAAPARLAVAIVTAVPADADALADLPWTDFRANRIDGTGDLVAGHDREAYAGKEAVLGEHIAVADATSRHLDAHLPRSRLGNVAIDQLEGPAGAGNLDGSHLCHV